MSEKLGNGRRVGWILLTVVAVAGIAGAYFRFVEMPRRGAEARRQEQVRNELGQLIEGLKVPPEALFYPYHLRQRIDELRTAAFEVHGKKDFLPYANVANSEPMPGSGESRRLSTAASGGAVANCSYEQYWQRKGMQVCEQLSRDFKDKTSGLGEYLRQNRNVYEKEIRWRVEAIAESWDGSLAAAACKALAAGGDRSQTLQNRLEAIYLYAGHSLGGDDAKAVIKECGWQLPAEPLPPASQPAYQAAAAKDTQGVELPPGAVARLGGTSMRHGGWVRNMVFSPDSQMLASKGSDGCIRTWDLKTGLQKREFTFADHAPYSGSLFFAGNDQLVAAGSSIHMWNLVDGSEIMRIDMPGKESSDDRAAAVSRDGRLMILGYGNVGDLGLYELPSGKKLWQIRTPRQFGSVHYGGAPRGLYFSPDGKLVISDEPTQQTVVIDAANGSILKTMDFSSHLSRAVVSPDSKRICAIVDPDEMPAHLAATQPGSSGRWRFGAIHPVLQAWNLQTGVLETTEQHPALASAFTRIIGAFPEFFLLCGPKELARIDYQTLKPIGSPIPLNHSDIHLIDRSKPFVNDFVSLASPDCKTLATCVGATIRINDLESGKERFASDQPAGPSMLLGVYDDGKILYSRCCGRFQQWDVQAGQLLPDTLPPDEAVTAAAVCPKENLLAICSRRPYPHTDTHLRLRKLKTGELTAELDMPCAPEGQLQYSAASHKLIMASSDGTLCIWDMPAGKLLYRMPIGGNSTTQSLVLLGARPGETKFAAARTELYTSGAIRLFDGESTLGFHEANSLVFPWLMQASSDGNRLLNFDGHRATILNVAGEIKIEKVQAFHTQWDFPSHTMAWLEKDDLMLVGDDQKDSLYLFDLKSGGVLGRLTGFRGPPESLVVAGDKLYSGCSDGTVLVWNLPPIIDWCQAQRKTTPPTAPAMFDY
jgi:WD40 repeat protein